MKNLFVTGGCGFIGANFVEFILDNEMQHIHIFNLDALLYSSNQKFLDKYKNHKNYTFIHGNILDRDLILRLLKDYNIDTVVHFAAESHVDKSIVSPDAFIHSNIVGTYTLVEACRIYWNGDYEGRKFIHISTDEVYGSIQEGFSDEAYPYQPSSPYSASKSASDHIVKAYYKTYGFPAIVTNCSNNYGPNQFPEKLIPSVITKALSGNQIPIYGDGSQKRDWLFVEDHVRAILVVSEKGALGESYNIGGSADITNLEIVQTVLDELALQKGLDAEYLKKLMTHVTDRLGHDVRYAIDDHKIRSLGWFPEVSLTDGIRKTVAWYISQTGEKR